MRRPAVVNGKVMRTPSYEDSAMVPRGGSAPIDVALSINQEFVAHDARTHTRDKALLVALGVNGEVSFFNAASNAGLHVVGQERGVLFARREGWMLPANDNYEHAVAA